MDGYGIYARRYAETIGALGVRSGVYLCTCLPWSECFDPRAHTLLKPHRVWCGACFLQDLAERRRPYIRLYWRLGSVAACVLHRTQLSYCCHVCGRLQSHLPRLPFCDRCNHCGALLHVPSVVPATALESIDAQNTYELLSVSHREAGPPIERSRPAHLVQAVANQLCDESVRELERLTGVFGLRHLVAGKCRPTLVQFIRFCGAIGCSTAALVTGDYACSGVIQARTQDRPLRRVRKVPSSDGAELRAQLEALARERDPPLPLKEIARRLGRSVSILRHRYPRISQAVTKRWLNYHAREVEAMHKTRRARVLAAFEKCHIAGQYPSDRHLKRFGDVIANDVRHPAVRPLILEARRQIRLGR